MALICLRHRFLQVSLNWSVTEAQPGEQVSLSVSTLEPRSQVGIVVTGTHDKAPQRLKVKQVRQADFQKQYSIELLV